MTYMRYCAMSINSTERKKFRAKCVKVMNTHTERSAEYKVAAALMLVLDNANAFNPLLHGVFSRA